MIATIQTEPLPRGGTAMAQTPTLARPEWSARIVDALIAVTVLPAQQGGRRVQPRYGRHRVTGPVSGDVPDLAWSPEQTRRIRKVLEEWLPAWGQRMEQRPELEPGSSLARDHAIYPNCVAFAWHGMSSAVDHLKAVRTLWLDAGTIHALADATLLRAALLGAATAVYLLDGGPGIGRHERLRRAGLAGIAEHRDHLDHLEGLRTLTEETGPETTAAHQELVARVQGWKQRANQVARDYGANSTDRNKGLSATRCIIRAGEVVATGSLAADRRNLRSGIRTVWQTGSADAHARLWPLHRRSRPGQETLAADLDGLANGLMATALVLNEAWRLLDLRRLNHLDRIAPLSGPPPHGS